VKDQLSASSQDRRWKRFWFAAEGRDLNRTVFRRSEKLQGKIKYQKSKCKMTNQKSKGGQQSN
jgi:hypothetical protein